MVMGSPKLIIEICGLLNDINFTLARCCAQDIYEHYPNYFVEPCIRGMLSFDWDFYISNKKKDLQGEMWKFAEKAIIFVNGDVIGGQKEFINWAKDRYNFQDFRPLSLYAIIAMEDYKQHMNYQNSDYVFFDVTINGDGIGRLVIQLYTGILPKTCANFKALCTSGMDRSKEIDVALSYMNSIFHRIVPKGWLQGGDIFQKHGIDGKSIYYPEYEDETYSIKHDKRGIVGMANRGRHTNQSQFYITLLPTPWMDNKHVAFGRVIEGTETLLKMEAEETLNERPIRDIRISYCDTFKF